MTPILNRCRWRWCSAVAAVFCLSQTASAEAPRAARAFFERHCHACHAGVTTEGGLDLFELDLDSTDPRNLATWAGVIDRVIAGEMPPAKRPRPSAESIESFVGQTRQALTQAWRERYARGGRTISRRLNPTEFENTLRDLLAAPWLELRGMLPPDPAVHGFDNVPEGQEISYVQLARFLEAAEVAIDGAMMLRPEKPPTTVRLWFQEEGRFRGKGEFAGKGTGDTRLVDEWVVLLRQPNSAQAPWRIDNKHQHEAGWYRLRVRCKAVTYHDGHLLPPERGQVSAINTAAKRVLGSFDVPPEGGVVEFIAWQHQDDLLEFHCSTLDDRNAGKDPTGPYHADGIAVEYFEIEGPFADAECRRGPTAGRWPPESHRRLFGDLPTAPWTEESGLKPPAMLHIPDLTANKRGLRDAFMPSPGRMMVVSESPREDAERLLRDFLRRAYRRPVEESEVGRCLDFAIEAIEQNACFQDAMRLAFKAALVSPDFLYFQERPGRLDAHALASRLSYLFWRSLPDEALIEAADAGRLRTRDGLLREFDRLLDDPKSARFVTDFSGQWLDLYRVHDTAPDRYLYPEYYCDTHAVDSAVAETEATFAEMLRSDLPAASVVSTDFAMVNERLAEIYGIEGVHGREIRRVALPAGSPRGGFLTQASLLKVTANGLTTSPVTRGAWMMDRLLGMPPPAPPPNAGSIDPDTRGATTVREQLEKHRRSESCAACHAKIDPPGFALENFDVLGAWRDRYRSFDLGEPVRFKVANRDVRYKLSLPVDASGETEGGKAFENIHDFRRILLAQEEQIARNLVERLLTFATGAGVTFADRATSEEILQRTRPASHGLRSILREIVLSETFRSK